MPHYPAKRTAWQDYMASQDAEADGWTPGNPAYDRAAKHMLAPGVCDYCGHYPPGWHRTEGRLYPIDVELGDRYIVEWSGWHSPCEICNPARVPPDGVTLLTFDPAEPLEPFEDWRMWEL